jgi:general secretion pathway protein N
MPRALAFLLVAAAAVLATALIVAPAQWMASAVAEATGDRVVLAEAAGSLWNGRASVVMSPGAESGGASVSLPEPLSWTLSPWRLLAGTVDLTLAHPSALARPLRLRADLSRRVEVGGTTLRLPAAVLVGLGAPFNTIRPGGLLSITWQRLEFHGGSMQGDLVGEWQFASSALSQVAPFGHYRLSATGGYPDTRLLLATVAGPLEMTGDGTIDGRGGLRFSGRARALPGVDSSTRAQLAGLITLLGRRDGDSAILSLGH